MYKQDPRLPVESILSPLPTRAILNLLEYGADV